LALAVAGGAILALYPLSGARAAIVFDDQSPAAQTTDTVLTRGEAVSKVVASFNLEKKQRNFLLGCIRSPDDCFFVFATMSDYDGIQFAPLILYPDVFPAYRHYKAINTASMLGLVHGYLEEDKSPFHPETTMTRIQALKVVMGAADALKWLEKFEMAMNAADSGGPDYRLPFKDINPADEARWWYPRYVGFALDNGIINSGDYFRPDEPVTGAELEDMIDRALSYSNFNEITTAAGNNVK
jgi:hypothetical protein